MKNLTRRMLLLLLICFSGLSMPAQTSCEQSCMEHGLFVWGLTGNQYLGLYAAVLCVQVEC